MLKQMPITPRVRALFGFLLGFVLMIVAVRIFTVNSFDFNNMERGVRLLLSGINPWADETRIPHFYNPPFSVIFLWPMLFSSPQLYLITGGALLFAFSFYHRAWVALAWFATNTALWLIAAGGIDMFIVGAGLILLLAGDKSSDTRRGIVLRILAYGLLMVKPQGTIFIVALYILSRRDWKGLVGSVIVYGLLFLPLYPDWLNVLFSDPPTAQSEAAHTLLGKFGPGVAIAVAFLVLVARRWNYVQLGGALAGILTPYGMPGIPIFLTLTGIRSLKVIPVIVIWSGCLAALTWVSPPEGVDYYSYIGPFMAIYHLSMLGLALVLACFSGAREDDGEIRAGAWFQGLWFKFYSSRSTFLNRTS